MNGKDKCRILKDIRRQIAESNDIEWVVSECRHKGACRGTCPKCESEVRQLEQALESRKKIGKAVVLAGVSAACMTGLTACSLDDVVDYGTQIIEEVKDYLNVRKTPVKTPVDEPIELDGDVVYIPDDLSGYMEPETPDDIEWLDVETAIVDPPDTFGTYGNR